MALRVFLDSNGTEWQAFDVVPREDERRRYDRRTSGETQAADVADLLERRESDRRLTIGGRMRLHSGVAAGWLCFETGGDRRRLAPIPEDWATASDAQLAEYLRAARPVRKSAAINPRR
jgi:hypothetical protein